MLLGELFSELFNVLLVKIVGLRKRLGLRQSLPTYNGQTKGSSREALSTRALFFPHFDQSSKIRSPNPECRMESNAATPHPPLLLPPAASATPGDAIPIGVNGALPGPSSPQRSTRLSGGNKHTKPATASEPAAVPPSRRR